MKIFLIVTFLMFSCIKNFKNIDFRNKDINEDLVTAIIKDDTNKAIKLIESGANINYISNGKSVIDLAIIRENLEVVKKLLENKIEMSDDNVIKLYNLALEDFNYSLIDLLKDKYKLEENMIDKNKYFLFLCYTSLYTSDVENFIKKNNIKPKSIRDKIGRNALIISVAGNKEHIFKLISKQYKLDVNKKDNNGTTSLSLACQKNYLKILELLLKEKSIDIDCEDNKRMTALMYSSERGHEEAVKKLLEKNASIDKINIDKETALILASKNGHLRVIELLLKKSKDALYKKDRAGYTALMLASQNGHKEIVEILIEKGANINNKNNNRWTALMLASQNGHTEMVNLLLKRGANINDRNNNGWTALSFACEGGHIKILKILLEKGANFDAKGNISKTFLIDNFTLNYRSLFINCFLNFVKLCELDELEDVLKINKLIIEALIEYCDEKDKGNYIFEILREKFENIRNKISIFVSILHNILQSFKGEIEYEILAGAIKIEYKRLAAENLKENRI